MLNTTGNPAHEKLRMKKILVTLTAIVASSMVFAQTPRTHLEEELLMTEKAAAQAFTDRNLSDYTKLIADDAVFFHMGQVITGKAAITEFSRPMFAGPSAPFSWSNAEVSVLPSGLAMTSGLIRSVPDGRTVARFNTVWRKQADGRWQIVFDRSWPASQ